MAMSKPEEASPQINQFRNGNNATRYHRSHGPRKVTHFEEAVLGTQVSWSLMESAIAEITEHILFVR